MHRSLRAQCTRDFATISLVVLFCERRTQSPSMALPSELFYGGKCVFSYSSFSFDSVLVFIDVFQIASCLLNSLDLAWHPFFVVVVCCLCAFSSSNTVCIALTVTITSNIICSRFQFPRQQTAICCYLQFAIQIVLCSLCINNTHKHTH